MAIDYNGDGLNDLLIFHESGYSIYKNNGTATNSIFTTISVLNSSDLILGDAYTPGDYNGDGFLDFIYRQKSGLDKNN